MAPRALATGRPLARRAGLCLPWLMVMTAVTVAEPFRRAPKFEGKVIPDPPRQNAPWTPPETKMPRFLVTATAALFEQGLADPRGCDYREVEVGDAGVVTTHGFVLPGRPGDSQRFAVGWDGVVYPAFTVGAEADLAADVGSLAGMLKKSREEAAVKGSARYGYAAGFTGLTRGGFFQAGPKLVGPASVETASALKVCLLLRLGRADLAEALFAAGTAWTPSAPRRDLTDYRISYQTLAGEWARRVYNRAVDAHGRADDGVALDAARRVTAFTKAAEAKLDALGFSRPPRNGMGMGGGAAPEFSPYFPDLGQLPELLADQERRAAEPPRGPVPGPDAPAAARIAALIRDLDQITGSGAIMNGISSPNGSDTERALVREGDAAVEPLLAVLESDPRLTRTVSYPGSRHGADDRSISYVFQPARSALTGLLKTGTIPGATGYLWKNDAAARKVEAAAIRAFWRKNRGIPVEDRWYKMLADDTAPNGWLEAANGLSAPAGPPNRQGRRLRPRPFATSPVRYGEKVPLRGDRLRVGKVPGVTDLIKKRSQELARPDFVPTQGNPNALYAACEMALVLARWEPDAAHAVLADMVRRCLREVRGEDRSLQGYNASAVATNLARLSEARAGLGDPKGLDDYADFLRSVDPEKVEGNLDPLFALVEGHPHHPAIAAAAEWVFNDPASPWLPFLGSPKRPNAWFHQERLIRGPMVGVAGFRKLLLRSLGDRAGFGKVTVDGQGNVSVRLNNGGSSGGGTAYLEPDGPKPPAETAVRVCDYFAWKLTAVLDGIPPCMLYWPEGRRDRAEAAQAEFLRRYGGRFADSPLYDRIPDLFGASRYPPAFPPLELPATGADVRDGLAVFSLEGRGETRVVRLAERPLAARWVTSKEYGFRQQSFDPKTNQTEFHTAYDRDGLVWQAEEVREGDRWQRYYGFVGRRMARVPAEEVEFPAPWFQFRALSRQLECQVTTPPPPPESDFPTGLTYEAGRPLPVGIRLRNRGGLDRPVPTEFVRERDGATAFRRGVDLTLSRAKDAPNPVNPIRADPGSSEFEPLSPRPVARFAPGPAARTLGPGESFEAAQVDLNTWYAMDRPGLYRLEVTIGPESDVAEGVSNSVTFRVTPNPDR